MKECVNTNTIVKKFIKLNTSVLFLNTKYPKAVPTRNKYYLLIQSVNKTLEAFLLTCRNNLYSSGLMGLRFHEAVNLISRGGNMM